MRHPDVLGTVMAQRRTLPNKASPDVLFYELSVGRMLRELFSSPPSPLWLSEECSFTFLVQNFFLSVCFPSSLPPFLPPLGANDSELQGGGGGKRNEKCNERLEKVIVFQKFLFSSCTRIIT